MKILYKIILILSFPLFQSLCQGSAGDMAKYEYRYLIDMPTAGVLERGVVGVTTEILPYGVLIASIEAGVFENVSIGISYGGDNLIGSGKVDWYNWPGVSIRGRIINEATFFPAITIGFDSQGKGIYEEDTDRFAIKSPGFFGSRK
ncbi:MAG: YjbH domain-containing protein [Ignavibacteriaceae bacterium]|nr:YjbH domain-containing protein [Ignavibacteriaceae bacterium]